jgi:Leucine-rich repeat (LRR) protein
MKNRRSRVEEQDLVSNGHHYHSQKQEGMYETKYAGGRGRLVGRRENELESWGEEDALDDVDLMMVRPISQSSSVHGRRDSGVLGELAGRDSPILGWGGSGAGADSNGAFGVCRVAVVANNAASPAAGLPVVVDDDDRDDRDQSAYFTSPRTQEPRPPSFTSFLSIESDTTRRDSRSSYREPRPPSSAMVSDEAQGAAFSNHPSILKSSQRESNPARGGSRDSDLHPALLPDSYPSHLWTPALSQASTSSTRSSAFTSHYRSSRGSRHLDIEVVDDMPTHDESGLVAPAPEQHAFSEPSLLKQRSFSQSKIDPTSRPSLYSRSGETSTRGAANQRSHATSWVLDDRGDPGLTTDEETDHDDDFDHEGDSFGSILIEQAQTKAAVIADEGRGAIINAEGMPVNRIPALHGKPNHQLIYALYDFFLSLETTHLLLSSSSTPNSIPSFLLTNLPNLSTTLLALDISANFLLSLPASLTTLTVLEELNVSSNPLRVLPTFLSSLHRSLRILIADSVGLTSLPIEMTCMKRLNVISLRRNKLHSVPDCVAGMDSLEELKLDGNIFLGPWKALVDPLLANYQPPTPQVAISGACSTISISDDEMPATLEEEHTIRAPVQSSISSSPRILTAPVNGGFGDHSGLAPLGRNRTLPTHYPVPRSPTPDARPPGQTRSQYHDNTPVAPDPPPAMRRMKSANELRDHRKTAPARPGTGRSIIQSGENKATIPLSRSSSHRYGGEESPTGDLGSKYATLSLGKGLHRQPTTPNLFESSSAYSSGSGSRPGTADSSRRVEMVHNDLKVDSNKVKWGFLKKMSMGRLKSQGSASSQSLKPRERPSTSHFVSAPIVPRLGDVPEIITSQSAGNSRAVSPMNPSPSPLSTSEMGEVIADVSQLSSAAGQGTSRSLRRRSFLPIDTQPSTLALPSLATPTVPEVSPAEEESGYEGEINSEMQENERVSRAKRTLFAYLQDMLDLNPMAVHSNISNLACSTASPSDQWSPEGARSRRPTLSENNPGRLASESSFTTNSSGTGTPSTPVNSGGSFSVKDTESGTSSARTSMFTSDSGDHQMEERKVKDDKAKRARVVREIVE